jgi:uncharacterized protein (DUF1697 family)
MVALLRGINVGQHKRIAMADLRELIAGLGYTDVRTLLNSGNLVFDASESPAEVAKAIEAAIVEGCAFKVRVVVRTADELRAVVAADPHAGEELDGRKYLVAFLGGEPDPEGLFEVLELDDASAGDGVLYLWCPAGVLDSPASKMANEQRLKTTVTARNWNTVTKLVALL